MSACDINGSANQRSITELSGNIGVLENLKQLLVGANPLTTVSGDLLRALPALEELDIGFSDTLDHLPDVFDATPSMRVLRAGNNRIEHVPASLYTCANLDELHLYGNCLKTLSPDISKLTRIIRTRTILLGGNSPRL